MANVWEMSTPPKPLGYLVCICREDAILAVFAVFSRCLLDRLIDIVIQCLQHDVDESSRHASSLPHQTCLSSALSASHLCTSGAPSSLLVYLFLSLSLTLFCCWSFWPEGKSPSRSLPENSTGHTGHTCRTNLGCVLDIEAPGVLPFFQHCCSEDSEDAGCQCLILCR